MMRDVAVRALWALGIWVLVADIASAASAQVTVIHDLESQPGDPRNPAASLLLAPDGSFYGTSGAGGAVNGGKVFRVTPAGIITVLHSFGADTVDAALWPYAPLVFGPGGYLYGTTQTSTNVGQGGAVFKISTAGVYFELHSFANDGEDGLNPFGALVVGNDGNLYGTTWIGGRYYFTDNFGGTIFRIAAADDSYSKVYDFGTTATDG